MNQKGKTTHFFYSDIKKTDPPSHDVRRLGRSSKNSVTNIYINQLFVLKFIEFLIIKEFSDFYFVNMSRTKNLLKYCKIINLFNFRFIYLNSEKIIQKGFL